MGLLTASAAQNVEYVEPGVSPLASRFGFLNRLEQSFNRLVVFIESSLQLVSRNPLGLKKLFQLPADLLKFIGELTIGH
jgi:hypothetical protein